MVCLSMDEFILCVRIFSLYYLRMLETLLDLHFKTSIFVN